MVQEEVGTGTALGTAGEEVVVVAAAEVGEVGVAEQGQVEETPQGLHLERGDPVAGWETSPSELVSAHWSKQTGSWEWVRRGVAGEVVEEEMPLH